MKNDFLQLLCVTVWVLLLFLSIHLFNNLRCENTAKELGFKCKYNAWAGCIIEKPDGGKVLLKQLRNLQYE